MLYLALAQAVLLVHLAFILFVLFGGLLALKWPRLIWWHLPAVIWGALTEFFSLPCPLTPLEKYFLQRGGESAYQGDFIAHYLFALIYPTGLTPKVQFLLGVVVVVLNLLIYGLLIKRNRDKGGRPRR